jgi:hypothetical protein
MVTWHSLRQHSSAEPEKITEFSPVIRFDPSTKGRPKIYSKAASNHPDTSKQYCGANVFDNTFSGIIIYNFHMFWT